MLSAYEGELKKYVFLFPDTHWEQMVEEDPNTDQVRQLLNCGKLLKIQWSLCSTLKNPTSSKYNQRIKDLTADAASLMKMPWEQAFTCQPLINVVSKALKAILEVLEVEKKAKEDETKQKRPTRRGRPRPAAMRRSRRKRRQRRKRTKRRRSYEASELGKSLQCSRDGVD